MFDYTYPQLCYCRIRKRQLKLVKVQRSVQSQSHSPKIAKTLELRQTQRRALRRPLSYRPPSRQKSNTATSTEHAKSEFDHPTESCSSLSIADVGDQRADGRNSPRPVVLTMWKPEQNAKELFDSICVTDVTSNMTTITVKECTTDSGFFKSSVLT